MSTTAMRKNRGATDEWMSLVEAAKALGETRQTVLTRAVKGEITADHVAGRTIVSRASVDALLAQRTPSGQD